MNRSNRLRKMELASYHRRTNRLRALGLNSRGRPFQRTPNLPKSQRAAHARKLCLAKYYRRAARYALAGLNTRGQPYARADKTAGKRLAVILGKFTNGNPSLASQLK